MSHRFYFVTRTVTEPTLEARAETKLVWLCPFPSFARLPVAFARRRKTKGQTTEIILSDRQKPEKPLKDDGAKPWCHASALVLYEQAHNALIGSITPPSFIRLHHLQCDKQEINISTERIHYTLYTFVTRCCLCCRDLSRAAVDY